MTQARQPSFRSRVFEAAGWQGTWHAKHNSGVEAPTFVPKIIAVKIRMPNKHVRLASFARGDKNKNPCTGARGGRSDSRPRVSI